MGGDHVVVRPILLHRSGVMILELCMSKDLPGGAPFGPPPVVAPGTFYRPPVSQPTSIESVAATRELFWHNVTRELLTSLSIAHAARGEAPYADDQFDGRLGVITNTGARIPIGAVYPVFACSLSGSDAERELSAEVECTVFQIETPEGQVFTLPVHEIRAIHSLSATLMDEIKAQAEAQSKAQNGGRDEDGEESQGMPFGFAAFTSLERSRRESSAGPAPRVGPDVSPPGASQPSPKTPSPMSPTKR